MGGIRQSHLAQKHRRVLEFFETIENRGLVLPVDLNAEAISLRVALFERVFKYEDAREMIEWSFPLGDGRAPRARGRTRRKVGEGGDPLADLGKDGNRSHFQDPWNWFADEEFAVGSLWIRLLVCAWDFWQEHSEGDPDDSPEETPLNQLLARLRSQEEKRRSGAHRSWDASRPSVAKRLEQARAAAWTVVVEEVLKAMVAAERLEYLPGRKKIPSPTKRPSATQFYLSLQARYDVERANLQEAFYDPPEFLAKAQSRQHIDPEDRLSAIRKEQVIAAPKGMVPKTMKLGRGLKKRNLARLHGGHPGRIHMTMEMIVGLYWTSASLPLCLMSYEAAAKVVLLLLLLEREPEVVLLGRRALPGTPSSLTQKGTSTQGGEKLHGKTKSSSFKVFSKRLSAALSSRGMERVSTLFPRATRPAELVSNLDLGTTWNGVRPGWEELAMIYLEMTKRVEGTVRSSETAKAGAGPETKRINPGDTLWLRFWLKDGDGKSDLETNRFVIWKKPEMESPGKLMERKAKLLRMQQILSSRVGLQVERNDSDDASPPLGTDV
jgi:hypothetical protein